MSEHHGRCHCGEVTIALRDDPTEAAECSCSLCRRLAGLWRYTAPGNVTVTGAAVAYRQGDCSLDTWHCARCGCTTHWTPLRPGLDRMGVNARMMDPSIVATTDVKRVDGAAGTWAEIVD